MIEIHIQILVADYIDPLILGLANQGIKTGIFYDRIDPYIKFEIKEDQMNNYDIFINIVNDDYKDDLLMSIIRQGLDGYYDIVNNQIVFKIDESNLILKEEFSVN